MTAVNPPDPAATPGLRDIVPPQAYHLPISVWWFVAGALVLAAFGWLIWKLARRPAKKAPPLTPRQLAQQRLRQLRAQAPDMEPRLFGVEVCDVLRGFLDGQYRLSAERQTSEEFLAAIAQSAVFSASERQMLAEFLEQSDLLKFARHDAALSGKEQLLSQAEQFVDAAFAPATPVPA